MEQRQTHPVGGVRTRPVRRVRVVGAGDRAVPGDVEHGLVGGVLQVGDERVAAPVGRRPESRRPRRIAVQGVGDPLEGGDEGGRLLAPGVPVAVHLRAEADHDRHAAAVVVVQPDRQLLGHVVGDRVESSVRLEGEQQDAAGVDEPVDQGVDLSPVVRAHRHLDGGADDGRPPSERGGVGVEGSPVAAQVRTEPGAVVRHQVGRGNRRAGGDVVAGGRPAAAGQEQAGDGQQTQRTTVHGPGPRSHRGIGRPADGRHPVEGDRPATSENTRATTSSGALGGIGCAAPGSSCVISRLSA